MAKIGLRPDREFQQIGQVIIAAWFKYLDGRNNGIVWQDLKPEIQAVLQETVDLNPSTGALTLNVFLDDQSQINVVIPYVPNGVSTIDDLTKYLKKYHDNTSGRHYDSDLGQAVIFGCGR